MRADSTSGCNQCCEYASRLPRRVWHVLLAVMLFFGMPILSSARATTASASQTDCLSYAYGCTPGYTGANASGTWAWKYYGGTWAQTPNGYHNCTLYVAWKLYKNGMADPGKSWGNAYQWSSSIGGADHNPKVGSVVWWGSEVGDGFGHVAYVEQVSGGNVYVRADNFSNTKGYTDAGWIAATSVDAFLHPHDLTQPPPPPPPRYRPNLLSNASFELGNVSGWNRGALASSVNYTAYTDRAHAHDGASYMAMNTSQANASVSQDVGVAAQPGESYDFSIWLRSPSGQPLTGALALWALGGTQESGATGFTLGSDWTLVTAPVDVRQSGHTKLRAEIYLGTTGHDYDADGAQLEKAGLSNASFELGNVSGWNRGALASSVNYTAYTDRAHAHDGASYMAMNTSQANASVSQDVGVAAQPGESYDFSIWLRSPSGQPLTGALALWALGGTQESGATGFTLGSDWTLVTAPVDVRQSGHTKLRAEIYLGTTGHDYDADGAQLEKAGLSNASFELGNVSGWNRGALASSVNYTAYTDRAHAHDGASYMAMNTSQANASVSQDVGVAAQPGESYDFSIWLRSPSGQPLTGALALWALGGTQESGATGFTLGSDWTLVTAPVDVRQSGHTKLRAEIYLGTTGHDYDADGGSLAMGNARPALLVPRVPTSIHASLDGKSIAVSWSPPADDGGSPIETYTVLAAPNGRAVTVSGSRSSATITSLSSGSYHVHVRATNAVGSGGWSGWSNTVKVRTAAGSHGSSAGATTSGYWMLGSDGHVYPFGVHAYGSATGSAVAIAPRPDGKGYWVTDASGLVSHFGTALDHGGRPALQGGERVSTISPTPSGNGYWLFTTRGRAFAYGDAHFYGDMSGTPLNGPVIASAATPTGRGDYMVGSDGGVFTFGDAQFQGSTGNLHLNRPVVGISPTLDNRGYWLVASDGGVFAFKAPFRGSMGATHLNRPVNGLVPYGNGYLMVASDGGVFDFSNRAFLGSLANHPPAAPIIAIAAHVL